MNSRVEGNGITSEQGAIQLLQQVKFSGDYKASFVYSSYNPKLIDAPPP
jgi:hypothetical protein